jgi:arylsulfatase A-like enzyme
MKQVEARADGEYLTDRLNTEAVDFISRHKSNPFLLVLSHYAVHTALAGKGDVVEKYKTKPGSGRRRNNPTLAAMIESIDDGVGLILDRLHQHHIANDTIVIFASDNGGEHRVTSNAPLRGGKSQLYEGGIRVPLIVRWPGMVRRKSICKTPVSTIDVYPTLCEIARAETSAEQAIDGESLVPLLTQTGRLKRDTLYWHYPLSKPHFLGGRSSGAVRQGNFKLIEFYDTNALELYNLKTDLGEERNLTPTMPGKVIELRRKLRNWRKKVGATMTPPSKT